MTVNLEKALIKANKKLITPEHLLFVKEYEQHAGLVENDSLERVGMNAALKKGHAIKSLKDQLKQETLRFKQERVFHISQIEKTCKDYYLRFLPSVRYAGAIDTQLPYKINNFEAAYRVKCQCDEMPERRFLAFMPMIKVNPDRTITWEKQETERTQNTFIMAPASSFELQEEPKDPLFFYKINDEYYYLIHKWGNDLSISRRVLGFLSNSFNFWLTLVLFPFLFSAFGFSMSFLDGGKPSVLTAVLFVIGGVLFFFLTLRYSDDTRTFSPLKNKWNSPYL